MRSNKNEKRRYRDLGPYSDRNSPPLVTRRYGNATVISQKRQSRRISALRRVISLREYHVGDSHKKVRNDIILLYYRHRCENDVIKRRRRRYCNDNIVIVRRR